MKCETIQNLIITDYLDHEVSSLERSTVEQHLVSCPSCRVFLEESKKMTVEPFLKTEDANLPKEEIWQTIQEKIEKEQTISPVTSHPFVDLLENLKNVFYRPQPGFVLASTLIVLLTIFTGIQTNRFVQMAREKKFQEKVADLAFVIEEMELASDDTNGYGTDIEEFFL